LGHADASDERLSVPRIPYGLDRLPRTMALDDPRLRCVAVGDGSPLRLNSESVPAEAMPLAIGDHAARVAAATAWLVGLCGDYAPLQRLFIASYFAFLAAHLDAHRAELSERVRPYCGLYAPEDFLWSALRPLPRGWVAAEDRLLPADMVFWDGTQVVVIELSARESERQKLLQAAGVAVNRIEPGMLGSEPAVLGRLLPVSFQRFWCGETLPASPFRRPIPPGVLAA
jgi:hypothetical protein